MSKASGAPTGAVLQGWIGRVCRAGAAALIVLATGFAGAARPVSAQLGGGGDGSRIEGRAKILPIPYLNYDRSLGAQGGAMPMVLFNPVASDTISPSSIAGAFGMYSANASWFVGALAKVHLAADTWRLGGALMTGTHRFQFYVNAPFDLWIPYTTDIDAAVLFVQRRVWRQLYAGVSYVHLDFETQVDSLPIEEQNRLDGLGLSLELDRRDGVYYPRGGEQGRLRYGTYPESFGNDASNSRAELDVNVYRAARERDVFAARAFVGAGIGELTFNQQFIVGSRQDMRGYTQGEYRGDYMVALQGEYRLNFHPRFGAVGFAGLATVYGTLNDEQDGTLLPAAGTGIRFTVDTETHMNIGLDIAIGRDDWGVYFKIGEAF